MYFASPYPSRSLVVDVFSSYFKASMDSQSVSSTAYSDAEESKDLKLLLEAFGSEFSLRDIASAYTQARPNIDMAAEILCGMRECSSMTAFSAPRDQMEGLSSDSISRGPYGEKDNGSLKSKGFPVLSVGTVSGEIGQDYIRPWTIMNESSKAAKPLKLYAKEFPEYDECYVETSHVKATNEHTKSADMEDFLFKMLGEGFKLDMTMIQDVLGTCGYDMQKSMEKLLDIPDISLEKHGRGDDVTEMSREEHTECESVYYKKPSQAVFSEIDRSEVITKKLTKSHRKKKRTNDIGKEILQSLFNAPERPDVPKITRVLRKPKRSGAFGKLVTGPYRYEDVATAADAQVVDKEDVEDDGDSYDFLREAAKEHWCTMKEYYKASVDAFAKGDRVRAGILMERGHLFSKKAREADEKSWEKIIEDKKGGSVMAIDLHLHEPKEALRLVRFHLTTISNIPSIKYLRVIVGKVGGEDAMKVARKKLILKQLEKEAIESNEQDDGNSILIQVDMIDPNSLSFAEKK